MNTQKSWISVVLQFVKAFFSVATDATAVVGGAVDMAERAVSGAQERQVIDSAVAMRHYRQEAVAVAALQRVKTVDSVTKYIGDDANRAALYRQECEELEKTLAAELAKLEAKRKLA
jgi:hypothetical protein